MKNYLKISVVLGAIALICSAILASLNLVTKPIIDDNSAKKQTETIQSIYSEYDSNKNLLGNQGTTYFQVSLRPK